MVKEQDYLRVVSTTKADIEPFIDEVLLDADFRDLVVSHLINNDSINIYYHSYLILKEATKTEPSLFYCYWDKFASLLNHENSYHRNYGMDLIANLVPADKGNLFELIFEDYYKQLNDEKVSTIKYCISNSVMIIKEKPHLTSTIISRIIESLRVNTNSEKHRNFLISEFLKLLFSIDNNVNDKKSIGDFLRTVLNDTKSDKIKREIKNTLSKAFYE